MKLTRISPVLFLSGWFSSATEALRGALAWLRGGSGEQTRSTDPDFDGWVANDPMVTMDPASRYGDDATGFLSGREDDDPKPVE
jgi:hypothetical protein